MIQKKLQQLLCQFLMNLSDYEKKIEISRQVLGDNSDFDAFQLFSILDSEKKNYINEINIFNFLQKKNGISCKTQDIQFLIFIYDKDGDGRLSFTEFLNLVLCEKNLEIRKRARQRIGSKFGNTKLKITVQFSILNLFQKELELIKSSYNILYNIFSLPDIKLCSLFNLIQISFFITQESVRIYLQKNFVEFEQSDILNIIKRLDVKNKSKINFSDFRALFSYIDLNH